MNGNLMWLRPDEIVVPDYLLRGLDPDKADVSDLLPSVKAYGVLQPILVRETVDGYELVAGWRRLKAAKTAGLEKIPVYVRDLDDELSAFAELVENIARRSLPPHREAEATLKLLAYRLGVSDEEAVSAIYRLVNYHKGLRAEQPPTNERRVIESTFSELGRSIQTFVTDILPTLKWPEDVLRALENGQITYREARSVRKIKDPRLRDEALKRVALGEPARDVVKEVLSGASVDKQVDNLEKQTEIVESWRFDEKSGYIKPPPVMEPPDATYAEAVAREYAVREVIGQLGWEGEPIALLHPDQADVQAAAEAGCPILWLDSFKVNNQSHVIGEIDFDKGKTIAFARILENRSEKFGDPNSNDPTAAQIDAAVAYYRQFAVVISQLEYAHLFGRRIDFVAVDEGLRVWAVML